MSVIFKVESEKLMTVASNFNQTGQQINKLTAQMQELIHKIPAQVWSGTAAGTYKSKFGGLQGDINTISKMINEHVKDLQEIARRYKASEEKNVQSGGRLRNNVIR